MPNNPFFLWESELLFNHKPNICAILACHPLRASILISLNPASSKILSIA